MLNGCSNWHRGNNTFTITQRNNILLPKLKTLKTLKLHFASPIPTVCLQLASLSARRHLKFKFLQHYNPSQPPLTDYPSVDGVSKSDKWSGSSLNLHTLERHAERVLFQKDVRLYVSLREDDLTNSFLFIVFPACEVQVPSDNRHSSSAVSLSSEQIKTKSDIWHQGTGRWPGSSPTTRTLTTCESESHAPSKQANTTQKSHSLTNEHQRCLLMSHIWVTELKRYMKIVWFANYTYDMFTMGGRRSVFNSSRLFSLQLFPQHRGVDAQTPTFQVCFALCNYTVASADSRCSESASKITQPHRDF